MKRIALCLGLGVASMVVGLDSAHARWGNQGGVYPSSGPAYQFPPQARPMNGGPRWGRPVQGGGFVNGQTQITANGFTDIRVQRPGLAVLGGVMQGVAAGLHADDPVRNRTAVQIIHGIGNGALLGAQPSITSGGQISINQGGQFGFFVP